MSKWAGNMVTSKNLAEKPALLSAKCKLYILISASSSKKVA